MRSVRYRRSLTSTYRSLRRESVAAFLQAGGVPRVATGEDRALIASLKRIDARIRHDPTIRVVVWAAQPAGQLAEWQTPFDGV